MRANCLITFKGECITQEKGDVLTWLVGWH